MAGGFWGGFASEVIIVQSTEPARDPVPV